MSSDDTTIGPGDEGYVNPVPNIGPQPEYLPGDTLVGRFRLVRRFAGSGQSQVWLAWERQLRRFVVLKFVHARLLDEARRAAQVPGAVVAVLEYNTASEGNPFLVLEFAAGGSAERYCAEWAARPALLVRTFLPVVRTIAAAHARGTIHRDLKPTNVLLWAEPPAHTGDAVPEPPEPGADRLGAMELRVADWGIATDEGDGTSRPGGTAGFAAPEQWRDPPTPAADVFGLAATLYFLLANPPGTDPWRYAAPTDPEYRRKAARGEAPPYEPPPLSDLNPRVDRRLARVIAAALAHDPAARTTSADAFAAELENWLTGRPVRGDGPARRAALAVSRNAVAAGLLLALAAVGALAGVSAARDLNSRADAAEARRKEAEAEALLARAEADRQRERLSEQRQTAARAAARRGDWPAAMGLYDELVRAEPPASARRFRAERLFGHFATNDEAALRADLAALEADPDLEPDVAAWAELVRGAHALCDHARAGEGRARIRAALAARRAPAPGSPLFAPADVLYAEALLETTPRGVTDKLRAAVRADALHFPARSALILTLLASGDPGGAARAAEEFAGLFPDSPVPAFVRAIRALVDGDRAPMRAAVAEFGRKAKADPHALAEYCEVFADVLDLMAKNAGTVAGLNPFEWQQLAGKALKMQALARAALKPVAFPVPTVNFVPAWTADLIGKFATTGRTSASLDPKGLAKLDADARALAAFVADYPEALAHNMLAVNRFVGGSIAIVSDDVAGVRARMTEAAEVAYRAAEQPTLFARAPTRFGSRVVGVIADLTLLKLVPDAPPSHLQRVHDNLPRVFAETRGRWHDHRDQCVFMFVKLAAVESTPGLLAAWRADTPAGRAALWTRTGQLYRAARYLLDRQAEELTADPGPNPARRWAQLAGLRAELDAWAAREALDLPVAPAPRAR